MKVILLEDVKSLGKKGEIVEVNEGYARNFILKKKVGIEASAKNMNDLKLKKANEDLSNSIQPVFAKMYQNAQPAGDNGANGGQPNNDGDPEIVVE